MRRATAETRAITRGRRYLVAQQRPDGLWPDPSSALGEGADWITGLVGSAAWALLADEPRDDGLEAALDKAVYALTRRQRANGGWASTESAGTDAEATAWALVCLLSDRRRVMYSTSRAYRYLYSHWDSTSGGFRLHVGVDDRDGEAPVARPEASSTAREASSTAREASSTASEASSTPRAASSTPRAASSTAREASPALPYVTAVALRALLMGGAPGPAVEPACGYLARAQGKDGLWRSPLWNLSGPPTAAALMALGAAEGLAEDTRARAVDGLAPLLRHADPVQCASAAIAAPWLGLGDDVGDSIGALLACQEADGGWTPLGGVRSATDSAESGRLVTTALVLVALHLSSL